LVTKQIEQVFSVQKFNVKELEQVEGNEEKLIQISGLFSILKNVEVIAESSAFEFSNA
jgi:hypothetical protein